GRDVLSDPELHSIERISTPTAQPIPNSIRRPKDRDVGPVVAVEVRRRYQIGRNTERHRDEIVRGIDKVERVIPSSVRWAKDAEVRAAVSVPVANNRLILADTEPGAKNGGCRCAYPPSTCRWTVDGHFNSVGGVKITRRGKVFGYSKVDRKQCTV